MALDGRKVNLFIVGAAKCGTTSLHNYLSQHPDIFMSPVKEPHFFCTNIQGDKNLYRTPKKGKKYHSKIIKDIEIYHSLFDDVKNEKIFGEASPSYLWDEDAAAKIYDYNPNSKIIILVRNPIERAFSHFLMDHKSGVEANSSFLEALKIDIARKQKGWGISRLYIELGMFENQINRFKSVFPDKQLKIVPFEDLTKNLPNLLNQICSFLEVPYSTFIFKDLKINNPQREFRYRIFRYMYNIFSSFHLVEMLRDKLSIRRFIYKESDSKRKIDSQALSFLLEVYKEELLFLEKFKDSSLENI